MELTSFGKPYSLQGAVFEKIERID